MTEQAKSFDQTAANFIKKAENDAERARHAEARKVGAQALEKMCAGCTTQEEINQTLAAALIALVQRIEMVADHSRAVAATAAQALQQYGQRIAKLEAAGNPPTKV